MKVSPRQRGPWLVLASFVLCPCLPAADDAVVKVEKVATEWVKTRAETVRLETEWGGQQMMLKSMVEAIDQRTKIIQEKKAHLDAQTAQDREELDTLARKNDIARAGLETAEERLKQTAKDLLALRPFLPPRLSTALDLAYQSIADPSLAVGDRMQHTMTILNRCLQFNRTITAADEVLAIPGEAAPKSLEVIYWGLSHGYALDRAAGKVWLGTPGSQGWQWEAQPGAAAPVAKLLAIASDKADPEFVVVPAKLGHPNR
ncbi:MAG TPA: DUF3450 family protein [Lacunisphaera sp.]|nr:DUF3450 family protein [Lacunisphaera sp.]